MESSDLGTVLTDASALEVGGNRVFNRFDIPQLHGVDQTAPSLHDHRASTLEETRRPGCTRRRLQCPTNSPVGLNVFSETAVLVSMWGSPHPPETCERSASVSSWPSAGVGLVGVVVSSATRSVGLSWLMRMKCSKRNAGLG